MRLCCTVSLHKEAQPERTHPNAVVLVSEVDIGVN